MCAESNHAERNQKVKQGWSEEGSRDWKPLTDRNDQVGMEALTEGEMADNFSEQTKEISSQTLEGWSQTG